MAGGGRKRGRTQRRHFKQSRENVWNHDSNKTRPEQPPSSSAATAAATEADEANPSWQPFATRNPNFEEYYKEQNIVAEDEWEEFISVLQKPLPAAFRINSSGLFFQDILSQLENDFVISLKAEVSDDVEIEAIRPLPWYPGKLAWHLNFSRMQLRKNQTLERFHEFLKLENEVGNITRQEAVSMVPPLFLDVLPDHHILDMCAAPGSKTFQLLEIIHQSVKTGLLPNGLVIANDVDVQRCNLLIHQTKRMCTANLIVTNHEAQHFPSHFFVKDQTQSFTAEEELRKISLQFDRVLCDVPCSGDGTLRKAPDIWRKWNAGMGNGLHRLQVEIAMRGIALLKVGGRMVYSTCSMNPVENEAVVAEVLRRSGGSVTLLDVSNEFPELVRRPGLMTWKIKDRGVWFVSYNDVPKFRRNVILPSMFPSGEKYENSRIHDESQEAEEKLASPVMCQSDGKSVEFGGMPNSCCNMESNIMEDNSKSKCELEEASSKRTCIDIDCDSGKEFSSFPLELCMRIIPHDQNGGAFFIAVLQKTSLQVISDADNLTPVRQQIHGSVDKTIQELKADVPSSDNVLDNNMHIAATTESVVDTVVRQSTESSKDNDLCIKNKDLEEAEPCGNDIESSNIGKKNFKGKLQMQGKWKGVDPVVVFEEESIIASIRSFYGISKSFPLAGHLVTRNSDANHVKRIYYISKSVQDILHFNFQGGERLKITSLGLKIFERQSSKDNSCSCAFRLSSEGLPLLLPYITKQILYASLVDFQHLLMYRVIKFPDFVDAGFREKASNLESGCCVVVLNEGNEAKCDLSVNGLIAVVCWKGKTNLSVMVSPLDGKELLERISARLGGQESLLEEETNGADSDGENIET